MVQFRTLNLLNDFSPLGTFDVVFCRNVLIYFDQPTKIERARAASRARCRRTAISCSAPPRPWSA